MTGSRYKDLLFIVGKESNEVYYVLMDEVNYNYRLSSLIKLAIEFSLFKLLSLNKNLILRTYRENSYSSRKNWIFKPGRILHYYFYTVSFVTGDRRFDWIRSEEREPTIFNSSNIKNHGHYILYKRGEVTYKAEKKRNGHKLANKLIDLVNILTFRLK